MAQLIHPELSYQVRGVLFHVFNTLGPMLREEYYENAIALGLEKLHIHVETQKAFDVYYEGVRVGLYFTDVWVEGGKLLIELKVAPTIEPTHKAQAISYLKVSNADLALIANFGGPSLEDERLPNFVRNKQVNFVWRPSFLPEGMLYPDLSNTIYHACSKVHFMLGPGFLHKVYRRATMVELRRQAIAFEYIKQLPVEYESQLLGYQDARLILIEGKIVLAVYALRQVDQTMLAQLRACLRRLHMKFGFLANFYGSELSITPIRTAGL